MTRSFMFLLLLAVALESSGQIYFANEATNIGVTDHTGLTELGNSLSVADYNNDGWDDITITSGENVPLRFYKNSQGLFFEEVLIDPPILYQTRSVNWVDYDNDGDKDLFVTSDTHGNRLFQMTDLGLIDVTIASGLDTSIQATYGASWGDVNNDGCLDVYISNRTENTSVSNYFYQSNCDGTFTDKTVEAGLANTPELTFCSGFFDFNNDGWQDLYVSNDKFAPNFMYQNNGDGTFTDVSEVSGTKLVIDAMSVTVDDYNADGFLDIYVTNTPDFISTMTKGGVLLKNNGDGTFTDVSEQAGVNLNSFAWGSNFLDADNDGDLDLYVGCSFDGSEGYPSFAFYERVDRDSFSQPVNIGFAGNQKRTHGTAICDINNDGKVDIVAVNNSNEPPFIWNNQTSNSNNYLAVRLQGTISNRDATGARIEISSNGKIQYRVLLNGEGYMSQNSTKETFGIGDANIVDYIKVTWPNGITRTYFDIAVNQTVSFVEDQTLDTNTFEDLVFNIYPNPVNEKLFIVSKEGIDQLEIVNMTGQKVLDFKYLHNRNQVDVSSLSSGVYSIRATLREASKTIRFIKE
ncbi:FG-GAP-like repeat-containing protein [Winogradskyella maritima]|uniref:FG-GAP-like repeat-containing protein n=1 Tax=Winogradskyella maritima TaxID=1517766 RepID=A0ABV8ACC8_9FLAO|nr:FG-GAP-like repeat-containing protein [Winogradskyella maritima]